MPSSSDPVCDRVVNHENVLGDDHDIIPERELTAAVTARAALADKIRNWGCDPAESREVDFEGAEAQLSRITNPDPAYGAPAVLFIRGVSAVEIKYFFADAPLRWENVGDLVIFRTPSGEFQLQSTANDQISQQFSAHLEGRIGATVWSHEIAIQGLRRGQEVFSISISREPHGLFAYSHPS